MIMPIRSFLVLLCCFWTSTITPAFAQDLLKVAVAGLSHDHAHVLLRAYTNRQVDILGIAEPDAQVVSRYQKSYNLPASLFFDTVEELLQNTQPDAVLAYNAISEHIDVAEVCLPMRIPLMVEKPLATTYEQASRIAQLAEQYGTYVLTNYETTWYESNQTLRQLVDEGYVGRLKKVAVKDGHQGPREIGCSEAFLAWLTDPEKNGGGALIDFGCYGANLMTWLMGGERPIAVTAVTKQLKPTVYPYVDDDATIVLEYKNGVTGVVQASWDWPYSIKDLHVYGEDRSLHAVDDRTLLAYSSPRKQEQVPLATHYFDDHLTYLKAVLAGEVVPANDLSSLANNLIVVEILDAARTSAQTGQRVELLDAAR